MARGSPRFRATAAVVALPGDDTGALGRALAVLRPCTQERNARGAAEAGRASGNPGGSARGSRSVDCVGWRLSRTCWRSAAPGLVSVHPIPAAPPEGHGSELGPTV